MVKLGIFLIGSAWLAYFSRASLLHPRSHGFYRFFAWEWILAVFLLNVENWFLRPLAPTQLISWLLLSISGYLVVHGSYLLRRLGRRNDQREDTPLIGMEKTTKLVTSGPYRYIRHPLYSSLLFLAWGIVFKAPSWVTVLLGAGASACLFATARAEEKENLRFFGPAYEQYTKRTKRFIPFLL